MKPKLIFPALLLILIAGFIYWQRDLFLKPGSIFGEKKLPEMVSYEPSMELMTFLERENFRSVTYNALPGDFDRVVAILKWIGDNIKGGGETASPDQKPVSLLEAAKKGQVLTNSELAIVTVALARSLGLPARVVHFAPADTASVHSVAEIFLFDQKRWVMVDPRWARIPQLGPLPIGAAEFSRERNHKDLMFMDGEHKSAADPAYSAWMSHYLYFMAFPIDQRFGSIHTGRDQILLMPKGASEPDKFLGQPVNGKLHGTTSTQTLYGFELK